MNARPVRMGQSISVPWWPGDAVATVRSWDSLVSRLSRIPNADARGQVLAWVGRSDLPGSPAERYQVIADDLRSNYVPATAEQAADLRARLDSLQAYGSQLEARVKNAEQAYGTLSAPPGAGSTPERGMMMECLTGGIALLGLIILPLVLD